MQLRLNASSLLLLIAVSVLFGCSSLHQATVPAPQKANSEIVKIEKLTTWYPTIGGCSTAGLLKGKFNACKSRLEDYLEGKAPCVLAATQRIGGTASLYGCQFFAPALQRAIGSKIQIKICAADIYAQSEDFGKIGASGTMNGSKLDIALRENSEYAAAIVAVPQLEVHCEEEILKRR